MTACETIENLKPRWTRWVTLPPDVIFLTDRDLVPLGRGYCSIPVQVGGFGCSFRYVFRRDELRKVDGGYIVRLDEAVAVADAAGRRMVWASHHPDYIVEGGETQVVAADGARPVHLPGRGQHPSPSGYRLWRRVDVLAIRHRLREE